MSRLVRLIVACNTGGMARLETTDVSAKRVDVGNDVSIPSSWTAIVYDEPDIPGSIRVRVEFDERLGRSAAVAVTVERGGEGEEVTSLTLREVKVQSVLQWSGLRVSTVSVTGGQPVSGGTYLRLMQDVTERTAGESIYDAATIYRLAVAVNLPPLKSVAGSLGVSQSTATRLMNRARMDGLAPGIRLPEADATGPYVGPADPSGPSIGR